MTRFPILMIFSLLSVLSVPCSAQNIPAVCPAKFIDLLSEADAGFCRCDSVPEFADVTGSERYSLTSHPCRSARHFGLLKQLPQNIVFIVRQSGPISLVSSERNGVLSRQDQGVTKYVEIVSGTAEFIQYTQRLQAMENYIRSLKAEERRPVRPAPLADLRTRMIVEGWTNSQLPPPSVAHFPLPVLPPPMSSPLMFAQVADVPSTTTQTAVPASQSAPAPVAPPSTAFGSPSSAAPAPSAAPQTAVAALPLGKLADKLEGEAKVIDTGRLIVAGQTIVLYGVLGEGGASAQGMGQYLAAQGNLLSCELQQDSRTYRCRARNNQDIAVVALFNGAARAAADAPEDYRGHEASARQARKGVWASQ